MGPSKMCASAVRNVNQEIQLSCFPCIWGRWQRTLPLTLANLPKGYPEKREGATDEDTTVCMRELSLQAFITSDLSYRINKHGQGASNPSPRTPEQ